MTEDLTSLLKRAFEVTEAATPSPWFHYADGVLRGAHTNAEEEKSNVEAIVVWRALAEPLLRVAEAAHATIGIGARGNPLMRDLDEALARLSEVSW